LKFLVVTLVLISSAALAAPDEDVLLKPKGLVDVWSRMDEFNAANGVQKPVQPRPLKRARNAPDLGLDAFLDANRNTGLLVLKGDTIVAERYQYGRNANHRFASASLAKTVLGMLVGIAISEGKIKSIDDLALEYVPALKGHPYGQTSIRHLLTMSSGMEWRETYSGTRDHGILLIENTLRGRTEGGVDTVLEFDRREAPAGTRFHYASGDSEVLGLVLRAAVGMPLAKYLSEKIWQPMGAEANATWLTDKGGYETGYCCINATLRDWGRFGLLLANGGARGGKQIIPADWVRKATHAEALHLRVGFATLNNGYGYQTWLIDREGRFAALGVRGQAIYIDPDSKIVVVHTAVWAENRDTAARSAQFQLWGRILKTLSDSKDLIATEQ
jgi:CubicO group peptidase (beta-lactamase class C family)